MKSRFGIFTLLLTFVPGFWVVSAAFADTPVTSDWIQTDVSKTRLVAGQYDGESDNSLLMGLQIQLAAGWKTYWRNPGDSGIPPRFNWQGSENIERVSIKWPAPSAFDSFGFLTWGYADEVVLPMVVELKDMAKPVRAQLSVEYGVCEKICIPFKHEFTLDIPAGFSADLAEATLVQTYLDKAPSKLKTSDHVEQFSLTEVADGQLKLQVETSVPLTDPVLILEGEDGDFFTLEQMNIAADHKSADFLIKAQVVRKSPSLTGRYLFATFFDEGWAVEGVTRVK